MFQVDKPKVETIRKRRRKDDSPKKLLKQTRLDFFQRVVPGRPQDAKQEDGKIWTLFNSIIRF